MHIKNRLKALSFLQFFIWGCWLITFGSYMINTLGFSGSDVGFVYSSLGIASLIMPSLIGILADKHISANYLYAFCHLTGACALAIAAHITTPVMMFWVMLVNAFAFIPTLSIFNAISYSCLHTANLDNVIHFPPIRAVGTIGFIVAMWSVSLLKLELNSLQLYIATLGSVVAALFVFTLPITETTKHHKDDSLSVRLGLDAFALFKKPHLALFFLFAALLGAVLQITNTFGNPFLHDFANYPRYAHSLTVEYPAILLSLSQISEVVFILFIPFFLRRYGIHKVLLISIFAWVLRFGFFAFGNPSPFGFTLLVSSMIVYGCAFDFFNISGSLFIEQEVNPAIRASAQGLFMTMVNGFGLYFGIIISGFIVDAFTVHGIKNWQAIWLIFSGYSLFLALLFYFIFPKENTRIDKSDHSQE